MQYNKYYIIFEMDTVIQYTVFLRARCKGKKNSKKTLNIYKLYIY